GATLEARRQSADASENPKQTNQPSQTKHLPPRTGSNACTAQAPRGCQRKGKTPDRLPHTARYGQIMHADGD
ncbi:hypothetical protein, partial [Paraburkholderia hospita]|uniref:hypothetical protein n=1 Tax=Paraburkholderia hospita TaxID=169430 RepID=UPI001A98BBCA